jgi:hypothetical protein
VLGGESGAPTLEPLTACSSPPIGVGLATGTRQTVVAVPGGSQICFYTDGVTEARIGSELFGAERLRDTLAGLGPRTSAAAVLDSVAAQADARPDDMAACLLSVEGGEGTPTVLIEEVELDRDGTASERTARFLLAGGVPRGELEGVLDSARVAAGRTETVMLELHRTQGAPAVRLRRDHLAYLHVPRVATEACR